MATIRPITRRILSVAPARYLCPACGCSGASVVSRRPQNRAYSSTPNEWRESEDKKRKQGERDKKRGRVVGLVIGAGALWAYYLSGQPKGEEGKIFNPPKFTPFTIVRREIVSPNSIIITLRPNASQLLDTTKPYEHLWKGGIWSVEAKQPELQIARSYTPLPPKQGDPDSYLRFYIRKEHKGEMSGYLHNLKQGAKVELRGPHPEYQIPTNISEVVFLAGGTGIAPALQVAHTLLEKREQGAATPHMHIVWANRRREDCEGSELGGIGFVIRAGLGLVVRDLKLLQEAHPGQLTIDYVVDEEKTFLDRPKIQELTAASKSPEDSRILFVSGPEGFINFVAGSKKWGEDGKEGQGELSGVLGQLGLKNWKVWKL